MGCIEMPIIPYACTLSNKTYLMKISPGYIESKLKKTKMIVKYLKGVQRKRTLPARSGGAWEAAHLLQDKVRERITLVSLCLKTHLSFHSQGSLLLFGCRIFCLFVCFRILPYISGLASLCPCSYAQGSEGYFSDILVFFLLYRFRDAGYNLYSCHPGL